MIGFFYNFFIILGSLIFIPKLLIVDYYLKKKYRKSLWPRLFPSKISFPDAPVIWLHGVSMGEVKALSTLIPHIKRSYPHAKILVSTVTETGYQELLHMNMPIDKIVFLPLDFPWIIYPFVRSISPQLFILTEGDYWLNLLKAVKSCGASTIVVNGKISNRSLSRYQLFKKFALKLFSYVDHFYLQGQSHFYKYQSLGIPNNRLTVSGNLKYDIPSPTDLNDGIITDIPHTSNTRIITVGSTHHGEEELIVNSLLPLLSEYSDIHIVIIPRHPERFSFVKKKYSHPHIHVITKMGVLPIYYAHSYIAIVGGSFVKGVGGHDIFEPIKMGIPTIFGPYMDKQVDLVRNILEGKSGIQIPDTSLYSTVNMLLTDQHFYQSIQTQTQTSAAFLKGSSKITWDLIKTSTSDVLLDKKDTFD